MRNVRNWVSFLLLILAGCGSGYEPVWQWPLESRSYAEPIVDGKTVYIVSQAGEVIAGSYETGKKAWIKKVNGAILASPAISARAVFAATQNGNVYALDKKTGNQIWTKPFSDRFIAPVSLAGDLILVPSETGVLYGISQRDGVTRWTLAGYQKFNTRALVHRSFLLLGGWSNDFLCLGFDGSIKWGFKAAYPISGDAVVDQNTVYFPAYDGFVYALEIPSGRMRWHSPVKLPTNVIIQNRQLIVGSGNQLLVLSAQSGQLIRRVLVKKPIARLYASGNDCLIVSGDVYRIDPISGRIEVLIRSSKPIFKIAITPKILIASDELFSISGFRK